LSWIVLGLEEFIIIYPNYPQFVMNCFFRAWRIHYHLSRNYPTITHNLSWIVFLGLEEFIIVYPAITHNLSWIVFLGLEEFIIMNPEIIPQLPTICYELFFLGLEEFIINSPWHNFLWMNFFPKKQKNIKNENGNIVNNIPKKFLKNHQIWGKKKREGILLNYYYFVKFGLWFSFGIIFRTIFFF